MRVFLAGLVAISLLAPHSLAYAEAQQPLVACPYVFNSVTTSLSPTLPKGVQSGTMGFTGTLNNTNTYPVKDVTVWMKVFHKRKGDTSVTMPDIVDTFPVEAHITLLPEEKKSFTASWSIPASLEPGEYRAVTVVTASDRFALSGLIYGDDVVSNYADFTVTGDPLGAVRFVRTSASVEGKPFTLGEFPVSITDEGGIPVSVKVENTSDLPYDGAIEWKLYTYDSLGASSLITTTSDVLKIHPHSSTTPSYLVTDTTHAVYYLEATLITKQGARSNIGIRFARGKIQEPRLGFVALTGSNAVVCVASAGTAPTTNSKVTLSVTRNTWYQPLLSFFGVGTLAEASYEGPLSLDLQALTTSLPLDKKDYVLTAELADNGKKIDSISLTYPCLEMGSACTYTGNTLKDYAMAVGGAVLLLILILGILWLIRKKRERDLIQSLPWNTPQT